MTTPTHFWVTNDYGWLVPPDIAQTIVHLAQEHKRILTVPIKNPTDRIYVDEHLSLSLGEDDDTPEVTYEWFFSSAGVDDSDENEVREYMLEHCFWDPESDDEFYMPDMDELVPEGMLDYYNYWYYDTRYSPTASAFALLSELKLGENLPSLGKPLGSLSFYEGCMPGDNSTGVQASNLEVVSGLQQRLIQLGQEVEVVMR